LLVTDSVGVDFDSFTHGARPNSLPYASSEWYMKHSVWLLDGITMAVLCYFCSRLYPMRLTVYSCDPSEILLGYPTYSASTCLRPQGSWSFNGPDHENRGSALHFRGFLPRQLLTVP
jgi:hypothetical protein